MRWLIIDPLKDAKIKNQFSFVYDESGTAGISERCFNENSDHVILKLVKVQLFIIATIN